MKGAWLIAGPATGALLATGAAYALGSWLVLALLLPPLVVIGFLAPAMIAIDARAIATARDPAAVEARAEQLRWTGTRGAVKRCWLVGAADLELAAKRAEFAADRPRLLALARTWRRRAADA